MMYVSFGGGAMDLAQWAEKSLFAYRLWCLSFHMGKEYTVGNTCDLTQAEGDFERGGE